jgi:hypothetical protein
MFESFAVPLNNYKILASGDNKNLIFWSPDKIYLYNFELKKFTQLYSGNQINSFQWLNNDYIIFTDGNKIIISEIDYRGNINTVTLPQAASSIFFNQQDGKIYLLNQNTFSSSEKITP